MSSGCLLEITRRGVINKCADAPTDIIHRMDWIGYPAKRTGCTDSDPINLLGINKSREVPGDGDQQSLNLHISQIIPTAPLINMMGSHYLLALGLAALVASSPPSQRDGLLRRDSTSCTWTIPGFDPYTIDFGRNMRECACNCYLIAATGVIMPQFLAVLQILD